MDLLLGLDVGTTATKALAIDAKGEKVASAFYNYGLMTPREDWVEQNPDDLWQGVIAVTHEVMNQLKPQYHIVALSISSQGGTLIPVDERILPSYNAISWMDHRAHKQADELRDFFGSDRVYEISGWDIYDGLPLLSICWLRQNKPSIFDETRYFLFVNDFIIYRLTGKLCMDPSDAGITQLYNIAEGKWDEGMLDYAGIDLSQLSPVRSSGTAIGAITSEASMATGLPESIIVVNGAHDQYCAALGTGVLNPGDIMLSCGTAWVILGVMDKLRLDPEKLISISPHIIPDRWGALKSMGAVGSCMEWFLDNLWEHEGDRTGLYDEMNLHSEQSPSGSKGLIFFPSSGGYGHGNRGAFIGLSISHSRGDMARSIMEGIAFDLRLTIHSIQKSGIECKSFSMVGGAANSRIWRNIVADITHVPVILPSVTQAASYGAAMLAGVGSKVFADPMAASNALNVSKVVIEADSDNSKKYDDLFDIYCDTYQGIGKNLTKLSEFDY